MVNPPQTKLGMQEKKKKYLCQTCLLFDEYDVLT